MPIPDNNSQDLSDLELALAKRQRKAYEFEVPDILGGSGKALGKLRIRLATLQEQDEAIAAARVYIEKRAKLSEAIAHDADVIENAKAAHILQKVCLRIDRDFPAFQGPEWMLKHFGANELGILLNNYYEVIRLSYRDKTTFTAEDLRFFAALCAENIKSDAPNEFLKKLDADAVAELAIGLGIMYQATVTVPGSK